MHLHAKEDAQAKKSMKISENHIKQTHDRMYMAVGYVHVHVHVYVMCMDAPLKFTSGI